MIERRNRRLARWMTGVAMAGLVCSLAVPAQADELEDLAIGQAWRGWSDARLVVPTAGLPYELNPTPTAFSRSYIDAVPGRSSAFASFASALAAALVATFASGSELHCSTAGASVVATLTEP